MEALKATYENELQERKERLMTLQQQNENLKTNQQRVHRDIRSTKDNNASVTTTKVEFEARMEKNARK